MSLKNLENPMKIRIIIPFVFIVLSCTQEISSSFTKQISESSFDKATYEQNFKKWKALGITSYSFTYQRMFGLNPDTMEIATVEVNNGVSTVTFSLPEGLEGLSEEEILSMSDYIYPLEENALKSIDEVFENTYQTYLDDIDDESITYLYSIEYDTQYFFPLEVRERGIYRVEVDGGYSYNLKITNFNH